MKGRIVTFGWLREGQSASALICDGRVEDWVLSPPDSRQAQPDVGTVGYATITRVLPSGRGAFCDLPLGATGYVRDAKGLKQGVRLPLQVAGFAEPGKAIPMRRNILIKGPRVILTPGAPGINASRKLTDTAERKRLTAVVDAALAAGSEKTAVTAELGAIIRTSAEGVSDDRLAAEVKALHTTWWIAEMAKTEPSATWIGKPGLFATDIEAEWLSNTPDAVLLDRNAASLAAAGNPEYGPLNLRGDTVLAGRIETDPNPLDTTSVLACLDALRTPEVAFPSGSMTIEPTRALVAVDVNTGTDFSQAAGLKANLAAARELPRQLRLRGLGGQIVVDFAPMHKKDRRTLEETLRKAFRADPVETSLVGWTTLGHFELQRKRERRPLHEVL
ncbi:MAG: ribonuclease E/G [Pseudomonadota bacterium]